MMIVAFCCSIEADSDLALCSSIPPSYQLPLPNQPNKSHRASIIIRLPLCIVTELFCSKGTAIRVSKLIRVGSGFCASPAYTSAVATALLRVCLDHTPTQIMIIRDYSQIARSYQCSSRTLPLPMNLCWAKRSSQRNLDMKSVWNSVACLIFSCSLVIYHIPFFIWYPMCSIDLPFHSSSL